jgi:hypothetical protein
MGEINIPRGEQDALKAVDTHMLGKLIEQCLHEEHPRALRTLRLEGCGPYVAARLRHYEKALAEYGKAKAAEKRDEAKHDARRAGSDLAYAIQQMKNRVEAEEEEGLLFYIDDLIVPPSRFSERVTVRVSYRWRQVVEDQWVYGSITFFHNVDVRPDYTMPLPKRRPSAAKQEQDRQEKLYREWEHLMRLGLYSIRDYFREGGNGAAIPQTFHAKADPYTRGLNNFSTKFWIDRS